MFAWLIAIWDYTLVQYSCMEYKGYPSDVVIYDNNIFRYTTLVVV